ncbi:hypothetical protein JYU20_00680 [Bacteroidales bacterium AH-315-I05]|nr:hypothetical protein [Bacteroidales bacterium AH-315-I05]
MKKFIEVFRRFRAIKPYGDYRLCWLPMYDNGEGIYSVMEFFDEELPKIDKKKIEILHL